METFTKKIAFYKILKYILFFCLFLVLGFAKINEISPFAFGMLFALVWCNQKIFVIAPMYVLSCLVVDFSVQSFLCSVCTVGVFVLFFALHYKLKKPLNKIFVGLYAFLSQAMFIYFNSFCLDAFLNALCYLVVGMVCMYAYLCFMQGLLLRGVRRKFALDEMLCAGVLFVALGAGIVNLPEGLSKAIFVFLALVLSFVLGASASISFTLLLGIGSLLAKNSFEMFLLMAILSLGLCVSKKSLPIFSALSVIVLDVFVNFYFFDDFGFYDILPTLVACLLFLLLSLKTLKKLKTFVICENEDFSARNFINKSKTKLSKKLLDTSNLFLGMQNAFVSMSKSKLLPEQAVLFVAEEAKKQVCSSCKNFSVCKAKNTLISDLQTLSSISLSRGNLAFFDIPSNLNANCVKSKIFVQKIDAITKDYQNFCVVSNNMDSSRMMLANQLFGVSQILKSLSKKANSKLVFCPEKEEAIQEELLHEGIFCSEVLIDFCEQKLAGVTLVVKNSDINSEKIAKTVSKTLKQQMEVKTVEDSSKSGFSIVGLFPKTFFDVIFGCSGTLKHGSKISGDNHLAFRICEDKIMMALCDGMGSGLSANSISGLALDLIERFYRAGFETDLILKNVNTLLSLKDEENFGALDICVFDLKLCVCDVLKLGAPVGFLKQKNSTQTIEAGALPIGILENVKPATKSFALNDGDMIILVTDGIVDAIENLDFLKTSINNFNSKNPQQVADMILDLCMKKCKNLAPDDMTVLVGKIWRKI